MNRRQNISLPPHGRSASVLFSPPNPIPYHSCCLGVIARTGTSCASLEHRSWTNKWLSSPGVTTYTGLVLPGRSWTRGPQQRKVSVGGADDQGVQALDSPHQCMLIMCSTCSLPQLMSSLEIIHVHHIVFRDWQRLLQVWPSTFHNCCLYLNPQIFSPYFLPLPCWRVAAGQGQPTTGGDREVVPLGGLAMDAFECHDLTMQKSWQEAGIGVGQQGRALAPKHSPWCGACESTSTSGAAWTSG